MRAMDVDDIYENACLGLPEGLRPAACSLAHRLGLAPSAGIAWSQVFKHEVTLAAPALIAETLSVSPVDIERAVAAHMLAVIEAFATDRVADGQIGSGEELGPLLAALRTMRNAAAASLDPSSPALFVAADRRSHAAIALEHRILDAAEAVDLARYESISADKQAVGFPAALALAHRGELDREARSEIERTLAGVWLGLQFNDDVIDWEDDWERGGAWAVSLALARMNGGIGPGLRVESVRPRVLAAGVLADMLTMARERFQAASEGAAGLGASRLASWASERAAIVAELEDGEKRHPGYAIRAHQLGFWAREVMA